MSSPQRLTAAVLGCGGIADRHCQGYRTQDGVEIVALADIQPDSLNQLGEKYGVAGRYTDYHALLEEVRPDLVSICTWPGLHAPMVEAAAATGVKGILCEKPLALNLGECDRILRACREAGVKIASGHHHRFNPAHARARQLIEEGAVGAPKLLRCRTNRGLTNNGSHGVDLMRYLLGDPDAQWVVGQAGRSTDRWERGGRIEEFGVGLIGFPGDVQAIIETDLPGGAEFFPTVVGEEGTITLHGDHFRLFNRHGATEEEPERRETDHTAEITELVTWVWGGPEHRGEARHARAAIEILMALYESARTHERIELPFSAPDSPLDRMIDEGGLPVKVPGRIDISKKR